MANILILTTYRGFLMSSLKNRTGTTKTICVDDVIKMLARLGHCVECKYFEELIDLKQYAHHYVIYASTEDAGLMYKDYIEDTILLLKSSGAVLIPEFELFRAHHNKAIMEGLRRLLHNDSFKTITSYAYASKDSYFAAKDKPPMTFPVVVKPSAGAGSSGVKLAYDEKSLVKIISRISRVLHWEYNILYGYWLIERLWALYWKLRGRPNEYFMPRAKKFIIQNFIPDLKFDYKVLVFDKKYYVLKRENRDNDFRASGSGKFIFPDSLKEVSGILDYARLFTTEIDSPFYSLDIGCDKSIYHLLEFQFMNFGPYTLQFSKWYFEHDGDKWKRIDGESDLETEYVNSIDAYIRRTQKNHSHGNAAV